MDWIERVTISWFATRHGLSPVEGIESIERSVAADPALARLLAVLRGAASPEQFEPRPESAGVRAILEGIRALGRGEADALERSAAVLDAFQASLREVEAAGTTPRSNPLFDEESGLASGLLFLDRLGQAIAYAHRHDTLLAVCCVYVDLAARPRRPAVAVEVAGRLRDTIRELDTVGRLGAAEFAIVINDLHSRESGMVAIRKIEAVLREPFDVDGESAFAEPRLGVAFYPAHGHDPAMLVESARAALPTAHPIGIFEG